jgi:ribosomal protein S27AE
MRSFEQDYDQEEWMERAERFADPDGNSALYPATEDNPRIYNCPNCDAENVLTAHDKAEGYQCDRCADMAEGLRPQW